MELLDSFFEAGVVVVYETDYWKFDRMIEQAFGQDFNFVADQEARNDTQHVFDLREEYMYRMDEYDMADVAAFQLTGEGNCMADKLLRHLVRSYQLPKAKYIINVSW